MSWRSVEEGRGRLTTAFLNRNIHSWEGGRIESFRRKRLSINSVVESPVGDFSEEC